MSRARFVRVGRATRGVEPVARGAVVLALTQDGRPTQSGLRALQDEELKEPPVVADRDAPLQVMVGPIERVIKRDPGATAAGIGRHLQCTSPRRS